MAIWRRFWVQKWPKLAQNSLKSPQTTPKMVRNDVGTVWKNRFWGHFGVILGSFWGHFGVILGHFGVILGSFWGLLGSFGVFWGLLGLLGLCWAPESPTIDQKSPKWPPKWPHGPKNGSIHAIMGPKKRLKNVFRGQNNGRKRIFRPWCPYKCC